MLRDRPMRGGGDADVEDDDVAAAAAATVVDGLGARSSSLSSSALRSSVTITEARG